MLLLSAVIVYFVFACIYLFLMINLKNLTNIISTSSKTGKNRNKINKMLDKSNKGIKLFFLWPYLLLTELYYELRSNRKNNNKT